jgi:hypothetical protein
MSKWAVVENGTTTEYHDSIPECWRNVSNMFAIENDLETLSLFGWYPVNDITKPLGKNQAYGEVSYTFDSTTKIVTQDCSIIDLEPIPPEVEFATNRNAFLEYLRSRRNELLTQSDWTQLQDIINLKSVAWQNNWKDYRQKLRDLPEVYINSYPNETQTENINWPMIPEG